MARFARSEEKIITTNTANERQKAYILVREAKTDKPVGVIVDYSHGPAKGWALIYFEVNKERTEIGLFETFMNNNPHYTFHSIWD